MPDSGDHELDDLARAALSVGDIRSAAIFVVEPGSTSLQLVAVAGIEGPALDGLVAAVRDPAHPIVRALSDDGPTFDVPPMNPGGPRLRSHLPLRPNADGDRALGVLALAHGSELGPTERHQLVDLADRAATALG